MHTQGHRGNGKGFQEFGLLYGGFVNPGSGDPQRVPSTIQQYPQSTQVGSILYFSVFTNVIVLQLYYIHYYTQSF